ncbi:LAETG motif-containing sortase-dependent surface protein [Streptomyces sp. NPDC088354]|uniref:LAETG motif-containing sortase-dependent surface protein n=1 Tax=unclassified Streptomyces TaxID=2593676 RepID=UPI0029AD3D18|nr:LAETG motif-containing sortase-dependent surface protein [Streptomyces sp. MI02-7b]MDX3072799.1 LAETG motif-containing sortase-dependent surface protein [Streptomyces sp. MI02-7b]
MTLSPRIRPRPGVLIAAAATSIIGLGLCAAPASAHTPNWDVNCSEVTFVDLKAYNGGVENTVTITVDGKDVLPTETFGAAFHRDHVTLPGHTSPIEVTLTVKAGDGARYSFSDTKTSPACQVTPPQTPQSPSQSATPSATPTTESPAPSESPTVDASASESEAAPSPAGGESSPAADLAETGASSSTPLLAGGAAVALLAGGGLLFANRKRRAARH